MLEKKRNDNSFKEKSFFGLSPNYSQSEMRDTWFLGIKTGLEEGLFLASLEGQRITINNNIKNERHREFYAKFCELSETYMCAIQYHPEYGMCVIDTKRNNY